MFTYLIETRNEYTTHLCNIISPFIYEGFKKMYTDIAFPKSLPSNQQIEKEEILYFFQKCLILCKDWDKSIIGNQTIIENETKRIINDTANYGYLPDLIKAVLKSHLISLMYNPSSNNQIQIDSSFYNNIKLSTFFYVIYIEFAKELWCNPYLMYHDYPPIEIKKNQRECIIIIKECIKEGIKKLLPFKQILYNYLKEEIPHPLNIMSQQLNKIQSPENSIYNNIKNIIEDNTPHIPDNKNKKHLSPIASSSSHELIDNKNMKQLSPIESSDSPELIDNKNIKHLSPLASSNSPELIDNKIITSDIEISNIDHNLHKVLSNEHINDKTVFNNINIEPQTENLDIKLKNILSNLKTDSEGDNNTDNNFYEIFSNSKRHHKNSNDNKVILDS